VSADNWGICPRCLARLEEETRLVVAEAATAIAESYGTVPLNEHDALRANWASKVKDAQDAVETAKTASTLREDYEIGTAPDGEFYVIYSCHCQVCGFQFKFKHEQQLEVQS
jgi:predicted Zn-ribbon and HTH transcriptional regulator